jgi:hypothetical protein
MGILAPVALALLALALPIIALYLLRPRRPPTPVSSLLLWRATLTDLEANAPWQRLRPNWLLLLQLAILALLALALARPFHTTAGAAVGNVILVLDGSASMRATDLAPNRFERARAEAHALVDRLGAGQRMAILLAGPIAEIHQPPTSDRSALRTTLDRLKPGAGLANWDDALALASATGQRLPGGEIVILSDGAFPPLDPAATTLPTRLVTVGTAADNLAIAAFSSRLAGDRADLFARVRNTGPSSASGLLSVYAGERLVDAREVTLAGGAEMSVTVVAAAGPGEVARAELDAHDLLAADDRAWLVTPAAGRVLLVAPTATGFLRHGLALLPDTSLFAFTESEPGYDWYVFDGVAPDRLPGPSLLIDPPAGQPFVPIVGELDRPAIGRVAADHPLLAGIDLGRLNIARASRVEAPAWAETVAASADGAPLLLAGERDGQRLVILAFDLHASDLPLDVAFPALLANTKEWLLGVAPAAADRPAAPRRPGEILTLPTGREIEEVVATLPDGRQQSLPAIGGVARLTETRQLGLYRLSYRVGGAERRVAWAAVNLLSDDESSIAPAEHAPIGGAAPAPEPGAPPQEEIWRPLLLVGLALLLAEWLLYYGAGALWRRLSSWRRNALAAARRR